MIERTCPGCGMPLRKGSISDTCGREECRHCSKHYRRKREPDEHMGYCDDDGRLNE